jgi:hypothetical protein
MWYYELWVWFLTSLMIVGTAAFAWTAVDAAKDNGAGILQLIAGCALCAACASVALIFGVYAMRIRRSRKRLVRSIQG